MVVKKQYLVLYSDPEQYMHGKVTQSLVATSP